MTYTEKKVNDETRFKFEYHCEDLFGEAWIYSVNKLDGDTLDEIVVDIIMTKKIKKGHTADIEFAAEFKDRWEEIKEDDEKPSMTDRDLTKDEYNKLFNDTTMKNKKSRVTTAILAILLGGWGVHKFYLGQIGLGLVYLLFCWTLIPSLIAFIEFIILITMSDNEFNNKYN